MTTNLYGGSIKVVLPSNFIDASDFRQVPDNQEVFVNDNNNDSIVFDILERVNAEDEDAVQEHVKEIAVLNNVSNELTINSITKSEAAKLKEYSCYQSICSFPSKKWGKNEEISHTVILICVIIRLTKVSTDLVISYNIPLNHVWKPALDNSFENNRLEDSIDRVTKIINTLEIADWSLFG